MILDNELLFDDGSTDVGASVTSAKVIDLGKNGSVYDPIDIQVNLSTANTAGTVASVKVQSSTDAAFTTPVDEATFYVPSSVKQTKPCVLAQFKCPITFQSRYVRLQYAGGTTAPTGGKITAFMTKGLAVSF